MRTTASIVMLATLVSCDNSDARWAAECDASRKLYQTAVSAMCMPWGESREAALSDLVEASRSDRFDEPVTGETIDDYVDDIDADDCIEAGFPDPGNKSPDPERERIRERLKATRERLKNMPPPGFAPEEIKAMRERGREGRTCDLTPQRAS